MAVWATRSESTVNAIWRLLVRLALIGAVLYACYRLRGIITTLFVAAIITYVLDPIVEWMSRRPGFVHFHSQLAYYTACVVSAYRRVFLGMFRYSRPPQPDRVRLRRHILRVYATFYVFLLAVLVLWQGTRFVVTPFVSEIKNIASEEGQRQIRDTKEKCLTWYNTHAPPWAQSDKVEDMIKKSDLPKILSNMVAQAGSYVLESLKNIVEIVLLPVLAFYFIIDGHKLKREFIALVPHGYRRETLRTIDEFNRIMRAFVAGQFILCVLAGVVVGVGLALLNVKYPVILGVLAGITRAIPIIGPIIGGFPIVLLTLVTKGLGTALAVLAFFTFLHFAESKFIMPLIIGDRMELHPVIIIVVLLIGGNLGGLLIGGQLGALLGMFFAAPVAALVRVMVRRYWLHMRPHKHIPSDRPPPSVQPQPEAAPAGLPEAVK
ncbi:MAG TPA: AI-2E family transporter [Chthonomonadaceae bacterium]|nr:AI-2E family transporter [Chthonomonadaceae bacterium]